MWGVESKCVLMTEYERIHSVMALQASVSCFETCPAVSRLHAWERGAVTPRWGTVGCWSRSQPLVLAHRGKGKDVGPQEAGSGFST